MFPSRQARFFNFCKFQQEGQYNPPISLRPINSPYPLRSRHRTIKLIRRGIATKGGYMKRVGIVPISMGAWLAVFFLLPGLGHADPNLVIETQSGKVQGINV